MSNDRPDETHPQSVVTRRQVVRGAVAGGAMVSAGGLLAACGGASGGTSTTGTGAADPPAAAKAGGVLRIGVAAGGASDSMDAHKPIQDADIARVFQLYDPLVSRNAEYEREMMLAESVEPDATARKWTVKLREGITFHNGKDVTADDVLFSLSRILKPGMNGAGVIGYIDLKKTRKLDARTVEINLKYPNANFPEDLGQYFNGIVPVDYDPKKPVGTGPFMFKSFSAGRESTFVKNPNYWRGDVLPDELVILDLPDPTARYNALQSGSIHGCQSLPATRVSAARGAKLQVVLSKTGNWMPITMRVDRKPFDDVRVRQAMRLIVDRPQMVEQALGGFGRIANDLCSPFDEMYASSIPQRVQDIEQAKALLKAAGQSDLRVELTTAPYADGMAQSAQVMAEQAKQAGVTIKLNKVDAGALYGPNYLKWTFSQDYWYTRSYIAQAARTSTSDGTSNETHFANPEFDKLIKDAMGTLDDAKRKEILLAAQKIEWETGGLIIWGFFDMIDAYGPKVAGFKPAKSGIPMGNWGFWQMGTAA
jgi:peptide/nickel transport system substrate-binding protein